MLLGIYFYLQILFCLLMLWAFGAAFYMGVFHAHRGEASVRRKLFGGAVSACLSVGICFLMYTWTYLSW